MRRRITRIALSLLLGATTTIAIAWSLACLDIRGDTVGSHQQIRPVRGEVAWAPMGGPADGISVRVNRSWGRVFIAANCYGPDYRPGIGLPGFGDEQVKIPPDLLVPVFARDAAMPWLAETPWPRGHDVDRREVEASGWPLLALASEVHRAPNYTNERRWSFPLPGGGTRLVEGSWGRAVPRVLPLRPLWGGLILNMLLFAGCWCVLLFLPKAIRRATRRRRNLCPTCAYPRKDLPPNSPCPECGRQV